MELKGSKIRSWENEEETESTKRRGVNRHSNEKALPDQDQKLGPEVSTKLPEFPDEF